MKIKETLKLTALVFVAMLQTACGKKTTEVAQVEEKKPNIIFILTDDQRWDALGYVGNKLAHTPEMHKLAERGVFFKNTIATTPICSASRASIISGLQERTHNYSFTTTAIKDVYMENAYPRLLKKSGYYTGLYGKFGVKYKKLDSLYDAHENFGIRYNKKDYTSYYYKTLGKDTVHLTRYTGEKALQFIDKAPADKPFCLQVSFSAPHASDNTVEQYFWQEENNHILENVTVPEANIATDAYYDKLPQLVKNGFNRLRWHWRYDTPEKYQHSVKGYFRMLAGIDNEIAKIRAKLEAKGIADNTVIVVMGDNGFFLGERQIAGKWLMYDNSLKVPLIIYDPRNPTHKDVEQMALNIDIPSTILDFAGVKAPATWHGKSLKPFVEKENVILERDTILVEHLWDFKNITPSEGVRTKDWKYFRYVNDKSIEELYNLKDDPRETNNLVDNAQYQDVLKNLRAKCEDLINKYKDPYALEALNSTFDGEKFQWTVSDKTQQQTAYQILVASSQENIDNNIGDVWNSTRVKSAANEVIKPSTVKLKKGNAYFWKVRIYDELNRTGVYTKAQKI